MEPTHKQHLLLKKIQREGGIINISEKETSETHWELVRAGYLNNLILLRGWKFRLTNKALEYLNPSKP